MLPVGVVHLHTLHLVHMSRLHQLGLLREADILIAGAVSRRNVSTNA